MNDMKTKQWFVKVHYNNKLIETREVWSDTEHRATIYAHSHAYASIDTQIEMPAERQRREISSLIDQLALKLDEARQWDHEWPQYMDETDEEHEARRRLHSNISEWSGKLCEARQTFDLKYGE